MGPRQTLPNRWLLVTEGSRGQLLKMAQGLPRGSGILLLVRIIPADMRRLRQMARSRGLRVADEKRGTAVRVHNLRELRRALASGCEAILLSPIYPTNTHPDWRAIPRMRAAAMARLAGRKLIALGGMDERRYANVARLGFIGWAGVSAFRT